MTSHEYCQELQALEMLLRYARECARDIGADALLTAIDQARDQAVLASESVPGCRRPN